MSSASDLDSHAWCDDSPDYGAAGWCVEIEKDGQRAVGTLVLDDVGFDGEDEYPIWSCRSDGGEALDFLGADRWRRLEQAP